MLVMVACTLEQSYKGLQLASIPYASPNEPHDLQNPSIILISILMHGALNLNLTNPCLSYLARWSATVPQKKPRRSVSGAAANPDVAFVSDYNSVHMAYR